MKQVKTNSLGTFWTLEGIKPMPSLLRVEHVGPTEHKDAQTGRLGKLLHGSVYFISSHHTVECQVLGKCIGSLLFLP